MKKIKLSQGKFALVDDADYDELNKLTWNARLNKHTKTFYALTNIPIGGGKYKTGYMHRMIMDAPKGAIVDHKRHDTLDNTRSNLRICTNSENMMNQKVRESSLSGYKGVTWASDRSKWRAIIRAKGNDIRLGSFDCKHLAAKAYNTAAIIHHGEFALLNKIKEEYV